jgi:hypothetical protein
MGDGDAHPDLRFYSLREHGLDATEAVVVLGSDGLFNHVGDAELLDIVATGSDVRKVVHDLVLRAIQNGSDDNVTAAALMVRGKPPRRAGRAVAWAALLMLAVALVVAQRMGVVVNAAPANVRVPLAAVPVKPLQIGLSGTLCSSPRDCFAEWKVVDVTARSCVVEIAVPATDAMRAQKNPPERPAS